LSHDGIFAGTGQGLNLEVSFNPLEEQFNLPSSFVNVGHGLSHQLKVVAEKGVTFPYSSHKNQCVSRGSGISPPPVCQ